MSSILRVTTTLVIAGSLVAGCGGGAATPSQTAVPSVTAAPTVTLAPTPLPTPLPNGWTRVVMIEPGHFNVVDSGVTDPKTWITTGIKIQTTEGGLSDSRVNGTATMLMTVQADSTGAVAIEWGTVTIENAGGSWVGAFRGFAWNNGNESIVSHWLTGRGAYEGLTYTYTAQTGSSTITNFSGLIYRGSPPVP